MNTDYVTAEAFENVIIIYRTFFEAIIQVLFVWSIIALIITMAKIYLLREDKKAILLNVLDFIKYTILCILSGNITLITSLVYNGDGNEMNIFKCIAILVAIIFSILIIFIHKKTQKIHTEKEDSEQDNENININ